MSHDPLEAAEPLSAILAAPGSRVALVCPDDERSLTVDGLAAIVGELAGRLHALGVRRGDRVAIVLDDGPELIELLFALSALGAAAAPLNPAYTTPEYEFFLGDLAPRLLLAAAGDAPAAREAAGATPVVELLRRAGEAPALLANGEELPRSPTFEPGAARRRRARAAHERHDEPAEAGSAAAAQPDGVGSGTVAATTSSGRATSRSARCRCSTCTAWSPRRSRRSRAGGSVVVAAALHAEPLLDAGSRARRHLAVGRPDPAPDDPRASAATPVETLRFARSCSSALSPALMERAEAGLRRADARGLRDDRGEPPDGVQPAAAGAAHRRLGRAQRRGARSAIVDEHVARHAGGHARRGRRSAGPASRPATSTTTRQRRGVLRRLVPDRRPRRARATATCYLEGRLKEMIIRGGENISPGEIEEVLLGHPAVADAVCFGVDDEKYGEVVGPP